MAAITAVKEINELSEYRAIVPYNRIRDPLMLKTEFEPRLITTREAAALVRVNPRTILNWIQREAIPYVELPSTGGRKEYRIPLAAFLSSLSGTYDMAEEVRQLDERARAAGVTEEQVVAALADEGDAAT